MVIVHMMIALYGKNVTIHRLTDAPVSTVAINCLQHLATLSEKDRDAFTEKFGKFKVPRR